MADLSSPYRTVERQAVTTGAVTGNPAGYLDGVFFRRAHLCDVGYGDPDDTSGPYADAGAVIDLTRDRAADQLAS